MVAAVVPHPMTLFEGQKCEETHTREVHVKSTLYKSAPIIIGEDTGKGNKQISTQFFLISSPQPRTMSITKPIKISTYYK
jgi:hypothetical protein